MHTDTTEQKTAISHQAEVTALFFPPSLILGLDPSRPVELSSRDLLGLLLPASANTSCMGVDAFQ